MNTRFHDRHHAGVLLGRELVCRPIGPKPLVLALPRGGVPVGVEVARQLGAEFDVFIVRKLGLPGNPEVAMGAVATGGCCLLDERLIEEAHVSPEALEGILACETEELHRRQHDYCGHHASANVRGRCVILVDDGMATGWTMLAAARVLQLCQPERIVVAVPVASLEAVRRLASEVSAVVSLNIPAAFSSVGQWYIDFGQTSDAEVKALVRERFPARDLAA